MYLFTLTDPPPTLPASWFPSGGGEKPDDQTHPPPKCLRTGSSSHLDVVLEMLPGECFIVYMYYFNFILLFLMDRSNHHSLGIFIIVYLRIFIIIIFIRIWSINYPQDQTIITRDVRDEVDDILSKIPENKGFGILLL